MSEFRRPREENRPRLPRDDTAPDERPRGPTDQQEQWYEYGEQWLIDRAFAEAVVVWERGEERARGAWGYVKGFSKGFQKRFWMAGRGRFAKGTVKGFEDGFACGSAAGQHVFYCPQCGAVASWKFDINKGHDHGRVIDPAGLYLSRCQNCC